MRRWVGLAVGFVVGAASIATGTAAAVPSTDPVWDDDVVFSSYEGQWDIWTAAVEGGSPDRVADTGGRDVMPEWSPDRSTIAFAGNGDGDYDIWAVAPDGTNLRKLIDTPGQDLWPTWSPDGDYLAYMSDGGGESHVYVLDVASGATQRVDEPSGIATSGMYPSWSPDGTVLAFVGDVPNGTSTQKDVFVAANPHRHGHARGGRVTSTAWNESWPRVSPNGFYLGWIDQGRMELHVADFLWNQVGQSRVVGPAESSFEWSPNGVELATSTQGNVFVVGATNDWYSHADPPTPLGTNLANPVFSPDGSWILAQQFSGTTSTALYRVDLDGTMTTVLNGAGTAIGFAQFRPRNATPPAEPVVTATPGPGRGEVTFTVLVSDDGGSPVHSAYYYSFNGVDAVEMPVPGGPKLGVLRSHTDSGLGDGETRGFGLTLFNAVGSSPRGYAEARAPYLPGPPSELSASVTGGAVHLSWQAPIDDGGVAPTHYRIYRSGRKGEFFLLATVDGDTTDFTDSLGGKPEDYAVTAVNVVGEGSRAEARVLKARKGAR